MTDILALAATNLLSPIILSFILGFCAALARSDLSVPEAAAKAISLYLLFAIGFKGGASVASHGIDGKLIASVGAGLVLSFGLPFVAFALLRLMTSLSRIDAAAVAAHYGSISIVTFVAASSVLDSRLIPAEGYMVAVAAAMEAPAILSALWLVARGGTGTREPGLWREILLNGSIVLLIGAFAIGMITGEKGLADISSFVVSPFKGVLCLFLLDMGLVAGRGLREQRGGLGVGAIAFALTFKCVYEVGEGFHRLPGDAFKGPRADVWCDDHLRMMQQWVLGWRGFLVEHVGGVTGELSGIQGCDHGRLVDEFSPAGVDEPSSIG